MSLALPGPRSKLRWRRLRRVGAAALAVAAFKSWLYLVTIAAALSLSVGVDRQVVVISFIIAVLLVPLAVASVAAIRRVAGGAIWAALARTKRVSLWLRPDNAATIGLLAIGTILPPVVELGRNRPGGTAIAVVLAVLEAWIAIAILASTKEIDGWIGSYRQHLDHLRPSASLRRDPARALLLRLAAWVVGADAASTTGLLVQLVAMFAFLEADPLSPWRFTPLVPFATALIIAGLEGLSRRLPNPPGKPEPSA